MSTLRPFVGVWEVDVNHIIKVNTHNMATAKTFTNYSDEDFTHKWDGVSYTFPTGKSMMLEAGLALHFAKHLAVRELNKKEGVEYLGNKVIETEMMKALEVEDTIEAEDATKLAQETMNHNKDKKEDKKEDEEENKKEDKDESSDLDEFEEK